MATQRVLVPFYDQQSVDIGVGFQGALTSTVGWRLSYDARIGTGSESDVGQSIGGAIRVGY